MDAASAALAARDVAGFMESWTDDGLQQVFYEFGDAFVANTGYHIGAGQYSLGAATAPSVHGDTATTVAPLFFRLVGVVREFTLVRVDLGWRIDGAALTTTDVPDADPVDVAFGESSMVFDSSTVTDGDIALQIHNPTTRRHQLNILSAPPEQDLAAFFEHPEDAPPVPEGMSMPEGVDFVGGVVGIEPGASVTMVFSQALPAARYFMFCNSEDGAPGEPHSKRGEFLEFTIG
ncbi:MAG: hypothetical protein ACSLFN_13375 [Candidatus Limnocylindrales bacterium]